MELPPGFEDQLGRVKGVGKRNLCMVLSSRQGLSSKSSLNR